MGSCFGCTDLKSILRKQFQELSTQKETLQSAIYNHIQKRNKKYVDLEIIKSFNNGTQNEKIQKQQKKLAKLNQEISVKERLVKKYENLLKQINFQLQKKQEDKPKQNQLISKAKKSMMQPNKNFEDCTIIVAKFSTYTQPHQQQQKVEQVQIDQNNDLSGAIHEQDFQICIIEKESR